MLREINLLMCRDGSLQVAHILFLKVERTPSSHSWMDFETFVQSLWKQTYAPHLMWCTSLWS